MKHVTKETAVLLKEKGFDLNTYDCYIGDEQRIDKTYREFRNHNSSPLRYSSPTLYEATEWLRAKGVHVIALPSEKKYNSRLWIYAIFQKDIDGYWNHNWTGGCGVFQTHDLALEAGIIHALKNYVK
jgi:hypothetical protein